MRQTSQKTETTQQTAPEKESVRQRRPSDGKKEAALALEAILAGGNWTQLPEAAVGSLSRTLGNSALAELLAVSRSGPQTASAALPRGDLQTAPAEWSGTEPDLAAAPDFGAMSSLGETAPMEA